MKESMGQNLLKNINANKVLDIIRKKGKVTKVELAEATELTFAAIFNIINGLLKMDMIKECGEGVSGGGRKPFLYELNSEALYVTLWGLMYLLMSRYDLVYLHLLRF